ncbi:16S rRNA (uracil(1498)-N(3))-methyltransferase [Aquicoccus sp.]|uniref:16S rRNA (uracil(1498)-N(3))-methyltransferase n=1 Tax=Aquicoccus sp. TaxID=2055851 RepID=UPI003568D750
MKTAKIRLYVKHPLGQGQTVPLDRAQAHYLFGVMRLGEGDAVSLFNGQDGEWRSEVVQKSKRGGVLFCVDQTAPQRDPPNMWLLFAPVKKARTDFIVEKATEMGAARIIPVQTDFTNSERIRQVRLQAHAIEAAEQCGGTFVPEVESLQRLESVLREWPVDRQLMFCDEALAGGSSSLPTNLAGEPWAILIGPEGGFSEGERGRLAAMQCTHPIALGPRILRADTAAVAAITVWQIQLGDWA